MVGADAEPSPCLCLKAKHEHGTVQAYSRDKCRCAPCRAAKSDYMRRQKRTVGSRCDAAGPRARLLQLRRAGLSYPGIARLTGLSENTLMNLACTDGSRRLSFVFASTAEALRRVRYLDAVNLPLSPGTTVDGQRARLQAQSLHAMGWCVEDIGEAAGIKVQSLYRILRGYTITSRTETAIDRAYSTLRLSVPAAETSLQRARKRRALSRAEENGWMPGMAEDEWAAAA